jgi:hypothetical protein
VTTLVGFLSFRRAARYARRAGAPSSPLTDRADDPGTRTPLDPENRHPWSPTRRLLPVRRHAPV